MSVPRTELQDAVARWIWTSIEAGGEHVRMGPTLRGALHNMADMVLARLDDDSIRRALTHVRALTDLIL